MSNGRTQADANVAQVSRAGEALNAITQNISRISEMNTQIASVAEEQSAVTQNINRNILNIREITEQTHEGVRQTFVASSELAKLAADLQTAVSRFKF